MNWHGEKKKNLYLSGLPVIDSGNALFRTLSTLSRQYHSPVPVSEEFYTHMASPSERSSSGRSTASLMPGRIVIACDATRSHNTQEFKGIIANIQARKAMIQEVDTVTVLGVLHKVLHPMGFQMQIGPDSFIGARVRAIKEEVSRMVDSYVGMLRHSAEECDGNGVIIEVKIVVGAPLKKVVVQEAITSNATWVVLNRHLRRELRFYLKHIPCKMALVLDNLSLEVLRPYYSDRATPNIEQKLLYTLSKLVPLSPTDNEQSLISPGTCSQESSGTVKSCITSTEQSLFSPDKSNPNTQLEKSGSYANVIGNCGNSSPVTEKQGVQNYSNSPPVTEKQSRQNSSDVPVVSVASDMKSDWDSRENTYRDNQTATANLSSDYLPREDTKANVRSNSDDSYANMQKPSTDSDAPCESEEMKIGMHCMQCSYFEVQAATNNFSSDNLLGEDGYGALYKGQLRDGQLIIAQVHKEANALGCSKFHSEACILSRVCHKNIVMLLGYCLEENLGILIYEYVCNKTLEWHLFDNAELVLEWHQRHAIAIGIAKGLRFLHEECRGSPIVHQAMRPRNIFLTHEFVPLLGDCGLVKWKTNKPDQHFKVLNTLEYLAPESAENGIYSVKTDMFAFGVVLIQLISGRKAVDSTSDSCHKSLRQWAMPLIQTLALDELVDPRLGDSYSTYELYQMARVAYLCIQSKAAMRPTIGEALRFLEGKSDHLNYLNDQLKPGFSNVPKAALFQSLRV